jgi:cytidylate kinase
VIIAVDGPAAAGKGTLARRLAARLDFALLDSGALYRAVAARLLAAGGDPVDQDGACAAARELNASDLERAELRSESVAQAASVVAAQPAVRAVLLEFQRRFAATPPEGKKGAVIDGRDIGTVVCPAADVKLFVTASPEERANRRYKELLDRGEDAIYARVLQEMRDRDARDSGRAAAPLKPADDAIVLDTTEMNADAVFETALKILRSRTIGS